MTNYNTDERTAATDNETAKERDSTTRAADSSESTAPVTLEELPWFALDHFVDDREEPSRVMVMPRALEPGSSEQWISIDASHAVPLDEVR